MAQAQEFYWQRHAAAEQLLLGILDEFKGRSATLQHLADRLLQQSSSRLSDWIDHLLLRDTPMLQRQLADLGFVAQQEAEPAVFYHPGALLPRIVLNRDACGAEAGVALLVECVDDFLRANDFTATVEGSPNGGYRRALLEERGGIALQAVERRACRDFRPQARTADERRRYRAALESWQGRPRNSVDEVAAWTETLRIVEQLTAQLGANLAAHVVCLGERNYWQGRNLAGRLQRGRQDSLGLGWANHDHHTLRSSRRNFSRLVALFSRLGFHCRERFYAGREAGWGAQVMENPVAGLSLFLDVDLAPEEVATDFTREELPEQERLGTIGLWCALHGDSIFEAGLHHLAVRCDFERLDADLARQGAGFMAPFSDFPYLKQAFSVAERWQPAPARVKKLVAEGRISAEQGEKFLAQGAVGSHLENIERREGYKGFNKQNVSAIILETDPRK